MRVKKEYLVISFSSTNMAMRMESKAMECRQQADSLREAGTAECRAEGRLIPLPAEISAGCGLAWKTEVQEKDGVRRFMEAHGIVWENMYTLLLY